MKKLTAIILVLLLAGGTMMGCDKETPQNDPAKNNITEQDSKETTQTEDVIKDYDQDDSQQGFNIYGKKHHYIGYPALDEYSGYTAGDVLILDVKNTTETNYTAAVTVTLFDEEGKKIKTETQEFKHFIAGFQNYFLFNTKDSFASYTCELSLKENTDEIFVDKLTFDFVYKEFESFDMAAAQQGVKKQKKQPEARFIVTQSSPVPSFYEKKIVVIFDSTGEICLIARKSGSHDPSIPEGHITLYPFDLQGENGKLTPEEFKRDFSYLVFPCEIILKDSPEYMQKIPNIGK